MKYEVYVESIFSAAHRLKLYRGKCEQLHGHNWKVAVVVSSQKLNKQGMVLDFMVLKKMLKKILDELDHKFLNKIKFFQQHQPTAENIAYYVYTKFKQYCKKYDNFKIKVIIWETPFQYASYEE